MKKNPQAVLIDLDDTIILDDSVSVSVWRSVCQKYALIIGKVTADELYTLIRAVTNAYWSDPERHRVGRLDLYQTRRELVAKALTESGLGSSTLGYQIADAFSAEKDRLIAPLPGAIETLQKLKDNHISLALVTNGGSLVQRSKIERFDLARYFNYILVEGEFGAGKPDRRVYEACLKELNVEASKSWMVGDDLNRDIGGAMQVGIRGIWVDWREKGLNPDSPVKPDLIISALTDLLTI
jgi:putative hydrolase of the HAD superfamily